MPSTQAEGRRIPKQGILFYPKKLEKFKKYKVNQLGLINNPARHE